MTSQNLLFLLGGDSAVFDKVANEFVPAVGGCETTIAPLLAGGPGVTIRISVNPKTRLSLKMFGRRVHLDLLPMATHRQGT